MRRIALQAFRVGFDSLSVHNAAETPVSVAGVRWLTPVMPSSMQCSWHLANEPLDGGVVTGWVSATAHGCRRERPKALGAGGAKTTGTKETDQAREVMVRDPEILRRMPM